jgi:hypothetical protein
MFRSITHVICLYPFFQTVYNVVVFEFELMRYKEINKISLYENPTKCGKDQLSVIPVRNLNYAALLETYIRIKCDRIVS